MGVWWEIVTYFQENVNNTMIFTPGKVLVVVELPFLSGVPDSGNVFESCSSPVQPKKRQLLIGKTDCTCYYTGWQKFLSKS
jgi:hypothetical protein